MLPAVLRLSAIAALSLFLLATAHAQDEVRALWVVRTTLTSPAAIATMVAAAKNGSFNTLLVQVRGRSAVDLPAAREHVVYRHPEWLMVPRALADEVSTLDPHSPGYLGRLAR